MIIKNILGGGWHGLASYLSQLSKSTTTDHINDFRIPLIHQPYLAINSRARPGKPAAGFNSLPSLSRRYVDGVGGHGAVLLQGHAHVGVVAGGDVRAEPVRRPDREPGGNGQKGEPGAVVPFLTNLAGRTPREMAKEVGVLRRLRPNLKKAISHLILSHDPTQRELTEMEWKTAIQIALKAHGAEETAFAAWIHFDTGVPHCHLMFCRVTASGNVVSDSNNFATNMRAARLIESTFMLDAPTPTPSEDRPGDRRAMYNAGRRAERMSTPGPEKISVRAVREALAQAGSLGHFQQLLAELADVESDFDRRGAAKQIYGWRLRRRGATEWLKASTLAKDLSWPKIAHRFVETDLTKQVQADQVKAEGPTAAPTAVQPARDKYARAPGALRQILRDGDSANQMPMGVRPSRQFSDRLPGIDMKKAVERIDDLNIGVAAQAMLILGAAAANLGIIALKCLLNFLQRLLALFGIGLRPISQNISGAEQNVLGYEPYIEAEMCLVEDPIVKAAELILQTADAIKDPATAAELLPAGEGRSELIEAINNEALQKENVAAEANPLDDIFCADMEAQTVQAAEAVHGIAATTAPATPQKPLWTGFIESVGQYKAARAAVARASEKDFFYIDERPDAWRQRDAVQAGLQTLEADFAAWRAGHKVAATLGADPHKFGQRISSQRAEIERVAGLVKAAERKDVAAKIAYDATPAPVVPAELLQREKGANAALRQSRIQLMAKARQNLQILSGYPMLNQQKEALKLQLQRHEGRLDSFMEDPKMKPDFIAELERTLRELHAAVAFERARLAPAPDTEPVDPDAPRA